MTISPNLRRVSRQFKMLTRTLLILFIINFALAAPVLVRERPEVHLNANVTNNVTAAPQKRWDPPGEGELLPPNVPYHSPPPSPDLSVILSEIAHANMPLHPLVHLPDSPGSPEFGYVPQNPVHAPPQSPDWTEVFSRLLPTNSPPHAPDSLGSFPVSDYVLTPVPSPGHAQPQSPSTDVWSQIEQLTKQLDTPPPSPDDPGSLTGSDHVPPSSGLPTGSRLPMAGSPSLSPLPPPLPHPSQSGPSEGRPPGFPTNPGTSSTGNQPTLPESPGVNPEMDSLWTSESFPTEFWDDFLKGIKPRSDSVNLAQENPRSQIFTLISHNDLTVRAFDRSLKSRRTRPAPKSVSREYSTLVV